MKVRNGFVSNSSSSSFVIIGKTIDNIEEITKEDLENQKIFCDTEVYGGEGRLGNFIDPKEFEKIISYADEVDFIRVAKYFSDDDPSKKLVVSELTEKEYDVIIMERDYHWDVDYIIDELKRG